MMRAATVMVRDILPRQYQVPAKYWYGTLRGRAEAEMGFLIFLVGHGSHAVDIGGNRGIYAYKLWRLGARVDIFEPNSACLAVLSPWAAGKGRRVQVHAVALSSRAGVASLHVPVDDAGIEHDASGSIEHGGSGKVRAQFVPTRTLDSYGFTDIDFIKIDVEGHEFSVIEGATQTCTASQPALLVEIEQRHNGRAIEDIFEKIASLGYLGYFLDAGQLVSLDAFDAARDQNPDRFGKAGQTYINNFLFLHRDRVAHGRYDTLLTSGLAA